MTAPWIVTYDPTEVLGERTPAFFQADMDARYAIAAGMRAPEAYGAIGDGSSDDTSAMQDWIDDWKNGVFDYGVGTPGKNYVITDELDINIALSSKTIDMQGSIITQATNGKGLFTFSKENTHHVKFANMRLNWSTQQTSVMGSRGITFDNDGEDAFLGWYGMIFENIRFMNAYRGFETLDLGGHRNAVWHSEFRNCWSDYGSTGSLMRLGSGLVGQPSLRILGAYQQREMSTEPTIKILLTDNLVIDGFEINGENQSAHNGIQLDACTGVRLNGRVERGTLGEGEAPIVLTDCAGVGVDVSVQAIQGFSGSRQAIVNCLKGDYSGARGTMGVRIEGVYTTYDPQPSAPASLRTAYVDDGSAAIISDSFVRDGAMSGVLPTNKAPSAAGSPTIGDGSIVPAKLSGGGTTPSSSTAYFGDGSWRTITSSGGGSTPNIRPGTMMFCGDSSSAVISPYNTTSFVDTHLGASGGHLTNDWACFANALEGSSIDILGSAATVGYSVAQIRDVHLPTILSAKPQYVVLNTLGGNDMMASGSFPTAVTTVGTQIVESVLAAGIKPILCTMFPINKPDLSRQEMARYNTFIYRLATRYDLDVLDFYTALSDRVTGYYKTGWSDDGVHPNAVGSALGQVPEARKLFAKLGRLRNWDGMLARVNDALTGQLANPLFPGTLGANAPTGYTGSNVAHNLVASSLYPGNEYSIAGTVSGLGFTVGATLAGSPGQDWDLALRWKTEPATNGGWGMFMYDQAGQAAYNLGIAGGANAIQLSMDKPFHHRGKFPAGVTGLQPIFYVVGVGSKMTMAQFTFRNTPALGSPSLTP